MGFSRFPDLDDKCVRATTILLKDERSKNWRAGSHCIIHQRDHRLTRDIRQADLDSLVNLETDQQAILESIVKDPEFQPENMRCELARRLCQWVKSAYDYVQFVKDDAPRREAIQRKQEMYANMSAEMGDFSSNSIQVML